MLPEQPAGAFFETGSFVKSTGSAPAIQKITTGGPPVAIYLYSSAITGTEDTITDNLVLAQGFTDMTNERSHFVYSGHGISSSDSFRFANSNKIIRFFNISTGANASAATVSDIEDDGFTLRWEPNNADANIIKYVIWYGNSFTAKVGEFTSPLVIGTQSVMTGLNTADFVMCSTIGGIAEDTKGDSFSFSNCWATGPVERGVVSLSTRDNLGTTVTSKYISNTKFPISQETPSPQNVNEFGDFDGFTSNGFDIDWIDVHTTSSLYYYLTIKGGFFEIINGTFPASAISKAFTTMVQPIGFICQGAKVEILDSVENDLYYHLGSSDATNEHAITLLDANAQSVTTITKSISSSARIITTTNNAGTVTEDEADIKTGGAFNATDATIDWTKNNGTAHEFLGVVVGAASVAGFSNLVAPSGGDYVDIQDAINDDLRQFYVEGGNTYTETLTFDEPNQTVNFGPGLTLSGTLDVDADNVVLVFEPGCTIGGDIDFNTGTAGCAVIAKNGLRVQGEILGAATDIDRLFIDGGGYDTEFSDRIRNQSKDVVIRNTGHNTKTGDSGDTGNVSILSDSVSTARAVYESTLDFDATSVSIRFGTTSADCICIGNICVQTDVTHFEPRGRRTIITANGTLSAVSRGIASTGSADDSVWNANVVIEDIVNDAADDDQVIYGNRCVALIDNAGSGTVAANEASAF